MSSPHAVRAGASATENSDADVDLRSLENRLEEEMRRLAAINQELLGKGPASEARTLDLPEEADEVVQIRADNVELRARIVELEGLVQGGAQDDEAWLERQKEYEALLEEKSEVIRSLHAKIQELQEGGGGTGSADPAPATNDSSVQRLHKELADQRRQLEEDEETLMKQMREMEMAMSRDRAELARQRMEIQRLHNELNREIELASRDPQLRERLLAFQRLQAEFTGRKPATSPSTSSAIAPAAAAPDVEASAGPKKSDGLLRRIFGK
jgi:hypothetical protein